MINNIFPESVEIVFQKRDGLKANVLAVAPGLADYSKSQDSKRQYKEPAQTIERF